MTSLDTCCSGSRYYIEFKTDNPEAYRTVQEICRLYIDKEKQIPKKPANKSLEFDGEYGYCPCCNRILADHSNFRRCPDCGQALDWSDKK